MPDPTDHRAAAEYWVREFLDSIGPVVPTRADMLSLARIHALLALSDAQAQPATTINLTGNVTREQIRAIVTPAGINPAAPSESQRCIARHGGLRCVFWVGHKDPHRGTWTDE